MQISLWSPCSQRKSWTEYSHTEILLSTCSVYMLKKDMTRYKNDLTRDNTGTIHKWNFVLYPLTSLKFLVTRCGLIFNLSKLQDHNLQKAFLSTFPVLQDDRPHLWYTWYTSLENHCATHHIYLPHIDETRLCNDPKDSRLVNTDLVMMSTSLFITVRNLLFMRRSFIKASPKIC